MLEISRQGVIRSDSIHHVLECFEVARVGTSMQFVLQSVLDLILEILGDVITVGNISNTGQRHSLHELICKGGQICLDTPDDKTVSLSLELRVKLLVQFVGNASVMVGSKMTLFTAMDMSRTDKVQES